MCNRSSLLVKCQLDLLLIRGQRQFGKVQHLSFWEKKNFFALEFTMMLLVLALVYARTKDNCIKKFWKQKIKVKMTRRWRWVKLSANSKICHIRSDSIWKLGYWILIIWLGQKRVGYPLRCGADYGHIIKNS